MPTKAKTRKNLHQAFSAARKYLLGHPMSWASSYHLRPICYAINCAAEAGEISDSAKWAARALIMTRLDGWATYDQWLSDVHPKFRIRKGNVQPGRVQWLDSLVKEFE